MGKTFPGRHSKIALRDAAAKESWKDIDRALGLRTEFEQFLHPLFVMINQFLQAQGRLAKWFIVRGQNQSLGWNDTLQFSTRVEPILQRVCIRLRRVHRYVRRDLGKQLVAGNENIQRRTPETGVLGRMTVAADYAP